MLLVRSVKFVGRRGLGGFPSMDEAFDEDRDIVDPSSGEERAKSSGESRSTLLFSTTVLEGCVVEGRGVRSTSLIVERPIPERVASIE